MSDTSALTLDWSVRGSDLHGEIQSFQNLHNSAWAPSAIVTIFTGKGSLKDNDIITPQAFAEILAVYVRFMNLTVTTSKGLVYSARDLCARGIMPDAPGGPVLPCLTASPVDCFSETTRTLDPSYAALDPIINLVMSDPTLMATPYATRPSFMNLTASQMKVEMSKMRTAGVRGCPWWTGTTVYEPGVWGGGLEWNSDKTLVTKATTLSLSFGVDVAPRVAYRMSLSKPQLANQADINEALKLFDQAWSQNVKAYAQTTTLLEVVNLAVDPSSEAASPWITLILVAVGFVLMQHYQILALGSWRYPMLSRANAIYLALSLVGLALAAATGLLLLCGVQINAIVLMTMPLLAYRLGLDHAFLLIHSFDSLGLKSIEVKNNSEIMREVFRKAGAGLVLPTLINIVAFGFGAVLPVKGVWEFCSCFCLVSFFECFAMMTMMPRILVAEANRIRARKPDMHMLTYFCHRRSLQRLVASAELQDMAEESVPDLKTKFAKLMEGKLAPALSSRLGQLLILALVAGLVAASSVGIAAQTVGYRPKELMPSGSNANRAFELFFERFTVFPAQLCFVDLDVPSRQAQMLDLFSKVVQASHAEGSLVLPYLTYFYYYVFAAGQVPIPGMNMTMKALGWQLGQTYAQPHYAPLGIASTNSDTFYEQFTDFRSLPQNAALAFQPGGNSFTVVDTAGSHEFAYVNASSVMKLRFSFFDFSSVDIRSDADILQCAADLRAITNNSPLKGHAFYYNQVLVLWSVFNDLKAIMPWALLIFLGSIACFSLLVLKSLTAALLATLVSGMIMLEAYGLSMFFLQFNLFLSGLLLSAGAISILHVAQLLAAFFQDEGSTVEIRLRRALVDAAPAMIHSSISVFLFILPSAFSPTALTVKYEFAAFSLVLFLGLINGLLVLPALLSLTSCIRGASLPLEDLEPGSSSHEVHEVHLPTVLVKPKDATSAWSAPKGSGK